MKSGEASAHSGTRIPALLTTVYGLSPLSREPAQFQESRQKPQGNGTLFSSGTSGFTVSECGSTQDTSLDNLTKQNGGDQKEFLSNF